MCPLEYSMLKLYSSIEHDALSSHARANGDADVSPKSRRRIFSVLLFVNLTHSPRAYSRRSPYPIP